MNDAWQELGLEMDCPQCKGTTKCMTPDIMTGGERWIYCPNCNATGKVPSAAGEHLLEFLLKHLGLNTTLPPWGIIRKK